MLKNLKNKLSNEKGFTLIEILVVISIIAILFVILLPQIDFAGDKARQAGVKTDFHTFQIAAESYMRETAGKGLAMDGLNKFLDKSMVISGTAPAMISAKQDPWNETYKVRIDAAARSIVITSQGKSEGTPPTTGTPAVGPTFINTADYLMATYYKKGEVGTCTEGFDSGNLKTNMIGAKKCGDTLPTP